MTEPAAAAPTGTPAAKAAPNDPAVRKKVFSFVRMLQTELEAPAEQINAIVAQLEALTGIDSRGVGGDDDVGLAFSLIWAKGAPKEEDTQKLRQFIDLLKSKGYFASAQEGTPQWMALYEKAKAKYYSRANPYEGLTGDQLKNKGNEKMKEGEYQDALKFYTKAIELDPLNAVYLSNRAAAHMHLEDYRAAIDDGERCIAIDPKYVKGWTRLAQAHYHQHDYVKAVEAFQKATELDPANEDYKKNLQDAKDRLAHQRASQSQPGWGGMDFSKLGEMMTNPQFLQMANNMMQNPEFSNMIQNFARTTGLSPETLGAGQAFESWAERLAAAPAAGEDPDFINTPMGRVPRERYEELQRRNMENPKFREITEAIQRDGPMAVHRYMADPEVQGMMSQLTELLAAAQPLPKTS